MGCVLGPDLAAKNFQASFQGFSKTSKRRTEAYRMHVGTHFLTLPPVTGQYWSLFQCSMLGTGGTCVDVCTGGGTARYWPNSCGRGQSSALRLLAHPLVALVPQSHISLCLCDCGFAFSGKQPDLEVVTLLGPLPQLLFQLPQLLFQAR